MCLPNFIEFKRINKSSPLTGYRNWRVRINNPIELISLNQDYVWPINSIRHKVTDKDSGIYAYNYNKNNNYYNNYNYNNNYNYYNNYYNNNYYYIAGIIHQYGKVAIHKDGYRSEYTKIITLFTIRKSDAKGPQEFLNWIDKFNSIMENLANKYKCNTIHYQDFIDSQTNKTT